MKNIDGMTVFKIKQYLKKTSISSISCRVMLDYINTRTKKYTYFDMLEYFILELEKNYTTLVNMSNTDHQKLFTCVHTFFAVCVYDKVELSDELISKADNFINLYLVYCKKLNLEPNKKYLDNYKGFRKIIFDLYGKNYNEVIDINSVVISDESDLTSTVEDEVVSNNNEESEQELKMKKTIDDLESLVSEKDKKIIAMQKQLSLSEAINLSMQDEVTDLTGQLNTLQTSNETLERRVYGLEVANDQKQKKISDLSNSEEMQQLKMMKQNEKIDDLILKMLIESRLTVDEIIGKLNSVREKADQYQVLAALRRIKEKVNIESVEHVTVPLTYGVSAPNFDVDKSIYFNSKCNDYMDLMFISDLHIDQDSTKYVLEKMDQVYDFCAEKGISTIINLGDLFDTDDKGTPTLYEEFQKRIVLLDEVVNDLPEDKSISHIILGGNHDNEFARYGIDPIKYIADRRMDIINAGYRDALLKFKGPKKSSIIGLHHTGVPKDELVSSCKLSSFKTREFITDYYYKRNILMDNVYFDFFGHTHKGKFDMPNGFGIVPSLNRDRFNNGAWYVRILFDNVGKIDSMLFYPLTSEVTRNSKLSEVMEIPYKKILEKK